MLSYEIDGSILTLRVLGRSTLKEREPVYAAVRADAAVPDGALLLLDQREIDVAMMRGYLVVERLRVLFDQLGPKLGPVCALLVLPELAEQARTFQAEALAFGLRVEVFSDEPSARRWLRGYESC